MITGQQIGGSIGTALLSTLASGAAHRLPSGVPGLEPDAPAELVFAHCKRSEAQYGRAAFPSRGHFALTLAFR
jgi:hypothetical protein